MNQILKEESQIHPSYIEKLKKIEREGHFGFNSIEDLEELIEKA